MLSIFDDRLKSCFYQVATKLLDLRIFEAQPGQYAELKAMSKYLRDHRYQVINHSSNRPSQLVANYVLNMNSVTQHVYRHGVSTL